MSFIARNHPQQSRESEVDDRATTPEVFGGLHERFGFTVDVAASESNAKLPRFYTVSRCGLSASWAGERVWCNPPYSNIRPWVEKAMAREAELCVLLLPANRTEQAWWQDLLEIPRRSGDIEVEFLRGRMRFLAKTDTKIKPNSRPPFGVCLVVVHGRA